jgi:hypothetical protein
MPDSTKVVVINTTPLIALTAAIELGFAPRRADPESPQSDSLRDQVGEGIHHRDHSW